MSTRALGKRQFKQDTLPGMEHLAPTPPEKGPNRYSSSGTTPLPGARKPVGMRGSVSDRKRQPEREARQAQGRARWDSMRSRIEDQNHDEYDDEDGDTPPLHPRTGLPSYGEIRTITPTHPDPRLGPVHSIGMKSGDHVPKGIGFHDSTPSARNAVGKLEWIPVPGIKTVQSTVSAQRLHETIDNPGTTQNPRIPTSIRPDVPHVFASHGQMDAEEHESYTVIDGNHRMSNHVLSGRLFAQARVLRATDIPAVRERTSKVNQAKARAKFGQQDRGVEEDVQARMNNRIYGTDNW